MSITIRPCDPSDFRAVRGDDVPWINVSATTARPLLRAAGLELGQWGDGACPADAVLEALLAVDTALGATVDGMLARAPMLRGEEGADSRMIVSGLDDEGAMARLRAMREVFSWAAERGAAVHWQ